MPPPSPTNSPGPGANKSPNKSPHAIPETHIIPPPAEDEDNTEGNSKPQERLAVNHNGGTRQSSLTVDDEEHGLGHLSRQPSLKSMDDEEIARVTGKSGGAGEEGGDMQQRRGAFSRLVLTLQVSAFYFYSFSLNHSTHDAESGYDITNHK